MALRSKENAILRNGIKALLKRIPKSLREQAAKWMIDYLRNQLSGNEEHVTHENGKYYWRPTVINPMGRRVRLNRVLGKTWPESSEEYHRLESELVAARESKSYECFFTPQEDKKVAQGVAIENSESTGLLAMTLCDAWKHIGCTFITRGGSSYRTVFIIWGHLVVGRLKPTDIDDGIRKMEQGDYEIPQRGGKKRPARQLSFDTIDTYLSEFEKSLAALRHKDMRIPDIFAQRIAQLPPGETLQSLIYPNHKNPRAITQRIKPPVYLDWETERLPFIAQVLASGLSYAQTLAAVLLTVSLTTSRYAPLVDYHEVGMMWEPSPEGNYHDNGIIVLNSNKNQRRTRKKRVDRYEVNQQLEMLLKVQNILTGGVGRIFPGLPKNVCDAVDRLAKKWGYSRLRAYLFKHSALTDLALIPDISSFQLAMEVNVTTETLEKYYIQARGVKARHYRLGERGASAISQLYYEGLIFDVERGIISTKLTVK